MCAVLRGKQEATLAKVSSRGYAPKCKGARVCGVGPIRKKFAPHRDVLLTVIRRNARRSRSVPKPILSILNGLHRET